MRWIVFSVSFGNKQVKYIYMYIYPTIYVSPTLFGLWRVKPPIANIVFVSHKIYIKQRINT